MKVHYPKISIITPSYNQADYLEETINSIISQDYPNLEYIIIDGGSSDNSVEIIKKYSKYLSYWLSEKDSGQSEAINKGFKKATGDIICWLNSDDIFLPGALHIVANYFLQNKEIDIATGYILFIDENSKIISNVFPIKLKQWYAKHGIYYITQQSTFWKQNIFKSVGYLNEELHTQMDKEFIMRVLQNNLRIGHFKSIVAGFRLHSASKGSLGQNSSMNLRDIKVLKTLYGKGYRDKPQLFFYLIYGIEKLLTGIYFKRWLFQLKWKGSDLGKLVNNTAQTKSVLPKLVK